MRRLPQDVQKALALGQKFAVQEKRSAPELVSLVRRVARCASAEESLRYVSDGTDALHHCKQPVLKCEETTVRPHWMLCYRHVFTPYQKRANRPP
ncbi:hypothetical protein V5799_015622 [Amblyomma americanum]|uniref:Uncharacterized protein n=1 Tax=Amblyomma americanum TaxID=6943 RepID=A0AAQ4F8T5_AMBAM